MSAHPERCPCLDCLEEAVPPETKRELQRLRRVEAAAKACLADLSPPDLAWYERIRAALEAEATPGLDEAAKRLRDAIEAEVERLTRERDDARTALNLAALQREEIDQEVERLKACGRALVKVHKGCRCQGHGLCRFCEAACDMREAMGDLG